MRQNACGPATEFESKCMKFTCKEQGDVLLVECTIQIDCEEEKTNKMLMARSATCEPQDTFENKCQKCSCRVVGPIIIKTCSTTVGCTEE